jgi:protein-tyrosine phosphatase
LQFDPDQFKSELIKLIKTFEASEDPRRIHVHCSAGIHRTGMVAYGLMRLSGLGPDAAVAAVKRIRAATADGVTEDRLHFVDRALR